MSGATRLLMLLSHPPALFIHRHNRCSSFLRLTRNRRPYHESGPPPPAVSSSGHTHPVPPTIIPNLLSLKSSPSSRRQFHSRSSFVAATTGASAESYPAPAGNYLWTEWSGFLESLSRGGYFNQPNTYSNDLVGNIPEELLRAAYACLAFAQARPNLLGMLSRTDMQVLVENGTPFLFRNGVESAMRLRLYVCTDAKNRRDTDKATTVDLMRFVLSYVYNLAQPETNNFCNRELVESSLRNLLFELTKLSYGIPVSNLSGSMESQFSDGHGQGQGQTPRSSGQQIEMKKGDWVCSSCSFMNFARNIKCLECEEARPKRQLTGGEWECPQCDFYNYGRNTVCLRCDCKRPGNISLGSINFRSGSGTGDGSYASKGNLDSRLAENEEKAQRWFSKVSQLDNDSEPNSAILDDDFPEIMPMRKGVNRFVVSTRKTPLERRLENVEYQTNLGMDRNGVSANQHIGSGNNVLDEKIGKSSDEILGPSSSSSASTSQRQNDETNLKSGRTSISQQLRSATAGNSTYVPFVPLPSDMFAKKPVNSEDTQKEAVSNTNLDGAFYAGERSIANNTSRDSLFLSDKPTNQVETVNKENDQADKSESWFKKVSELHNGTDLSSTATDEDFPDIMPMRKGENRFVVSRKKDRSLTSPAYKRKLATEQASNSNFVPFVPFPSDYFSKNDSKQSDSNSNAIDQTSNSMASQTMGNVAHTWPQNDNMPQTKSQPINFSTPNPTQITSGQNVVVNSPEPVGNTWTEKSLEGSAAKSPEPVRNTWTGKSLEGSAVTEPDPLDMSEEAKAERWFKRVAHIKDISELSQIPDEDFPSIMPMRKGVNRFVISKRKTPLERRLTSQQYRRNLPIISSDPVKKDNDSS